MNPLTPAPGGAPDDPRHSGRSAGARAGQGGGRPTPRARRSRDRRVLALGLLGSLVAHVLIIGLVGGLLRQPTPPPREPSPVLILEPPAGMRAVDLSVAGTASPDPAARPVVETPPERDPERPPQVVEAEADVEPDAEPVEQLTAAERLAPRLVDPRLWRPVILPRTPTFADVQARIAEAVGMLSDSALAETERAMAATDWTVEDDDGGRWGISPGKLHLGKLTLPLPIAFPPAMTPEDIASEREWYDIQAQAQRAELLESFEERVKAIRERRERERAERKPDSDRASDP